MTEYDVSSYIGIPYLSKGRSREGCDCWGLVRLFYREQKGVDLPSYSESYTDSAEIDETKLAVSAGRVNWLKVETPLPGDVVLMKLRGEPVHVGVYVGVGMMLHVRSGVNACLQRLSAPFWKQSLEGFYRYGE